MKRPITSPVTILAPPRKQWSEPRPAVELLATHPASGRIGRVPGTRELVITGTPYIVPYRVRGDAVEILRVFHGARKWPY